MLLSNSDKGEPVIFCLRDAMARAVLVVFVAFSALLIWTPPSHSIALHLKMRSHAGTGGEIFFRSSDARFTPAEKVAFRIEADGKWHDYIIPHSQPDSVDSIRIDPGSSAGLVEIRSLEIKRDGESRTYDADAIYTRLGKSHQAQIMLDRGVVSAYLLGGDPYLEVHLPGVVSKTPWRTRGLFYLLIPFCTGLCWLILEHVCGRIRRRVGSVFSRGGRRYFADSALTLTPAIIATALAIIVTALAFVGLKLNQSSIGVWNGLYGEASESASIEISEPKLIRSDEWRVLTPWVLNQVGLGGPHQNPNVGGDSAPLLASLPVSGIIGAPHLKYLGFKMLGIDYGFSWWWAYKAFGLVFSFFWLFLLLTRGKLAVSLLGALWIYGSSYTQWWFSSALPEILIAFALGVVGALHVLTSNRRSFIAIGAILVTYAAMNLLLNLYPPYILPLGYLGVVIVAGCALDSDNRVAEKNTLSGSKVVAACAASTAFFVYAFLYYREAAPSIQSMLHTYYPGHRISNAGGVPLVRLADGFFEAFRTTEASFPKLPVSYNASEASSYLLLFPLALIILPSRLWISRKQRLVQMLIAFIMLTIIWISVPLPADLNAVAHALGWGIVTPKRAMMALGIASIVLYVVLFGRRHAFAVSVQPIVQWALIGAVTLAVAGYGFELRHIDPGFFTLPRIALGSAVAGLLCAGLALASLRLVVAGVAILLIPGLGVNPLTSGTSALTKEPVSGAALNASNSNDRWLVVGDNILAQALKARGLHVVGGTNYLPDKTLMHILDRNGIHAPVWNRYATIRFRSDPGSVEPDFRLLRADQIMVDVDVCGPAIRALKITRIAYTQQVPQADLRCLGSIPAIPGSAVRLFMLRPDPRYDSN